MQNSSEANKNENIFSFRNDCHVFHSSKFNFHRKQIIKLSIFFEYFLHCDGNCNHYQCSWYYS